MSAHRLAVVGIDEGVQAGGLAAGLLAAGGDAGTQVTAGADVSLIVTERFCLVFDFDSILVTEALENFALPTAEQ